MKEKTPRPLLKDELKGRTKEAQKAKYDNAEAEALRIIAALPAKLREAADNGAEQVATQIGSNEVRMRVFSWLMSEGLDYRAENDRVVITWK